MLQSCLHKYEQQQSKSHEEINLPVLKKNECIFHMICSVDCLEAILCNLPLYLKKTQ
jgi:hypothetical protein